MKNLLIILISTLIGFTSYSQPQIPKLPTELKEQADAIKASVEAGETTHDQAKAEIKELLDQNKPEVGAEKPKRPVKPELSDELKEKIAELKTKQKEMNEVKQELREKLKNALQEDKEALIAEFKESNKEAHKQIKEQAKAIKQEIRSSVEEGESRTSDL